VRPSRWPMITRFSSCRLKNNCSIRCRLEWFTRGRREASRG